MGRSRIGILIGAFLILLSQPVFAELTRAFGAYQQGDYAAAYQELRLAADRGNKSAQNNLGVMYENGYGVNRNYVEAARWYRLASEQGLDDAHFNLGVLYSDGRGVPKDDAKAVQLYRRAADEGHSSAQTNLGFMYFSGRGLPQDYVEAARWYRLAANQGHKLAQNNLGLLYAQGFGIPQNDFEAVRLFKLAAEQGYSEAQRNLGFMYAEGRGVPKDYILAFKWESLAADQGNEEARNNLRFTERQMSRDQIVKAQQLASIFRLGSRTTATSKSLTKPSQFSDLTAISRIQSYLQVLGYDPGPIDGVVGPKTSLAIRAFQQDAGIEPDGVASTTLLALLQIVIDSLMELVVDPQDFGASARLLNSPHIDSGTYGVPNNHEVAACFFIYAATMEGSQKIGGHAKDLEQYARTRLAFIAGIFQERKHDAEFSEIFEATLSENKKRAIQIEEKLLSNHLHENATALLEVVEALESCDRAMGLFN